MSTTSTKTEYLECSLTHQEIREAGQALASMNVELEELEFKKKELNTRLADQIKEIKGSIGMKSKIVSTGVERRPVQVLERQDFLKRLVQAIRLDTGEVIRERPMTSDELQLDLFANDSAEELVAKFADPAPTGESQPQDQAPQETAPIEPAGEPSTDQPLQLENLEVRPVGMSLDEVRNFFDGRAAIGHGQVAKFLGVSPEEVIDLNKSGRLTGSARFGKPTFTQSDVWGYLNRQNQPVTAEV